MAAPNNPISGLLGPLSDYADKQAEMGQASKMLMGKYMLDQNAAASTRRFETLNSNIKGFEERRKDLESHKWNMLNALIDPQGDAFQGQQRSAILKQLGFDENTYQVMLGSLNTDLRSIDRVLQSNYQLRNEAYGFGQSQGVDNVYARGGGAGGGGTGAPTGEELLLRSFQQGGAGEAVTKTADSTGQEQGGQGWMADVGEMAQLTGGSLVDFAKGYWKWANDPNNFANQAFEAGLIDPRSSKNFAQKVYKKVLGLIPDGASEQQIQDFWLAPGLHERLAEVIQAGEDDKKSLDLWITENIVEGFDPYFKKFGLVLDDFGITAAAKKAVDVAGQLVGDARRYWFPSDAEIGSPEAASPPAAAPSSATPSAIVPPTPFAPESPNIPYHPMVSPPSQAPSPIPSGNLSGTPSPAYFGTGQIPAPDYMSEWQQFHENYIPHLPWDPRAVPADPDSMAGRRSNLELARRTYERNLQNLFYEGSQMGGSINAGPADANLPYSAPPAEISVVPTYEVFQQRIQGTPGDPGFYGSPMAPAATQQQVSVAQGTPGDPNLQGNVGLDTSVTSPLFQDPMGGGVGQPTMNQQTVPMAPMGGTEGVMSAVDEGAINPFITPGQPQGSVDPQAISRGFGEAEFDVEGPPPFPSSPSLDSFSGADDIQDPRAFGGIDLSGPVRPYEDRERSVVSRDLDTFVGDTWDDFTEWASEISPTIPLGASAIGTAAYWTGAKIRRAAFDFFNTTLDNDKIASIDKDGRTVERLESQEKQMKKDGENLDKDDKETLRKARNRLRNHKSMAWKKYLIRMGKKGTPWAIVAAASLYGITEAIGAERTEKLLGDALNGNQEAQFALDSVLKLNPIEVVKEMHQQPQSITTLRKERHSGPETHKAPGMLGAQGGMILNYPESAFPSSGLNSGAPQVQAMMSELEKKNQ